MNWKQEEIHIEFAWYFGLLHHAPLMFQTHHCFSSANHMFVMTIWGRYPIFLCLHQAYWYECGCKLLAWWTGNRRRFILNSHGDCGIRKTLFAEAPEAVLEFAINTRHLRMSGASLSNVPVLKTKHFSEKQLCIHPGNVKCSYGHKHWDYARLALQRLGNKVLTPDPLSLFVSIFSTSRNVLFSQPILYLKCLLWFPIPFYACSVSKSLHDTQDLQGIWYTKLFWSSASSFGYILHSIENVVPCILKQALQHVYAPTSTQLNFKPLPHLTNRCHFLLTVRN